MIDRWEKFYYLHGIKIDTRKVAVKSPFVKVLIGDPDTLGYPDISLAKIWSHSGNINTLSDTLHLKYHLQRLTGDKNYLNQNGSLTFTLDGRSKFSEAVYCWQTDNLLQSLGLDYSICLLDTNWDPERRDSIYSICNRMKFNSIDVLTIREQEILLFRGRKDW